MYPTQINNLRYGDRLKFSIDSESEYMVIELRGLYNPVPHTVEVVNLLNGRVKRIELDQRVYASIPEGMEKVKFSELKPGDKFRFNPFMPGDTFHKVTVGGLDFGYTNVETPFDFCPYNGNAEVYKIL